MLSHVSSSPPPTELPFFGWACLEDPCGGSGDSNAERGGDSGVANARWDGGERREGERTTWQNGSVRFRLIPIDGTFKSYMLRTEVIICPQGERGVPPG